MDLHDLLRELEAKGAVVEVAEGRVRVRPQSAVTPPILSALRDHKAELVREYSSGGNGYGSAKTPAENIEFVTSKTRIEVPIGRVPRWLDLEVVHVWADQPSKRVRPWCPLYGHKTAWRSVFGAHLICGTCHPPANDDVVAELIEEKI